jgi:hypothetical protein
LAYRSILRLLARVSFAGGVVDEQLSTLCGGDGKVYDFSAWLERLTIMAAIC